MDQDDNRHANREPILIQAEWQHGPRTPAWDALWRRILEEVLAPEEKAEEGVGSDDA